MKVIIASAHCTKTDLIDYQYKSIKKFVTDIDYEYIIFNDGVNEENINNFKKKNTRQNIENKCHELNIKCIGIPQEIHHNRKLIFPNTQETVINSCTRCANSTQYAFNYLKDFDAILCFIDSDMFFINKINIQEYLGKHDFCALLQDRDNIIYMWNGIYIMDLKKTQYKELINFDCGNIDGVSVDVGGHTNIFLQKNIGKYKAIDRKYVPNYNEFIDLKRNSDNIFSEEFSEMIENISGFYGHVSINGEIIMNNCIYHIRGFGGNWDYSNAFFRNYLSKKYKNLPELHSNEFGIEWGNYCNILSNIIYSYISKL